MASEIDDEAEPPPPRILVACHQKAAFFTTADMAATDLRHDLRHAGALIGHGLETTGRRFRPQRTRRAVRHGSDINPKASDRHGQAHHDDDIEAG